MYLLFVSRFVLLFKIPTSVFQKMSSLCHSPSSNVRFGFTFSSKVPEPKSISSRGIPRSSSTDIKSAISRIVATIPWKTQSLLRLTRNHNFVSLRRNNGTVVQQQPVGFFGDEFETQVTVVAHFQRWIPSPSIPTEASCRLLTSWPIVSSRTLTP